METTKTRSSTTPKQWLHRNNCPQPWTVHVDGVDMWEAIVGVDDIDGFKKVIGDRYRHMRLSGTKANYLVQYVA